MEGLRITGGWATALAVAVGLGFAALYAQIVVTIVAVIGDGYLAGCANAAKELSLRWSADGQALCAELWLSRYQTLIGAGTAVFTAVVGFKILMRQFRSQLEVQRIEAGRDLLRQAEELRQLRTLRLCCIAVRSPLETLLDRIGRHDQPPIEEQPQFADMFFRTTAELNTAINDAMNVADALWISPALRRAIQNACEEMRHAIIAMFEPIAALRVGIAHFGANYADLLRDGSGRLETALDIVTNATARENGTLRQRFQALNNPPS